MSNVASVSNRHRVTSSDRHSIVGIPIAMAVRGMTEAIQWLRAARLN